MRRLLGLVRHFSLRQHSPKSTLQHPYRGLGFGLVAVLLAAVGFGQSALAADSTPIMVVPGRPNVSPSGAFTYSVPISVAPGTAGMSPALSLDYSSQNGNGRLGVGWTLSGISAISRCPRTRAQDNNVHGSINYDADDRFCLDGQRLVLLNPSDTYGANGTEYRTEVESFNKIILHTVAGVSGPGWFEVHTKSGQTMEFGNTSNSRIMAQGRNVARAWGVNRISDSAGNYMDFFYNDTASSERANGGEVYPVRIEYAGHGSPAVAPYNSVHFLYSSRSDISPAYQAGSVVTTTKLLTTVEIHNSADAAGPLVAKYVLAYNGDGSEPATARRRLTSISQCAPGPVCLPPTTFTWQGSRGISTRQVQAISVAQGTADSPRVVAQGDFNGDGISDVVIPPADPDNPTNCGVYYGVAGSTVSFTASSMTAHYQKWEKDPDGGWIQPWVDVKPCENVGVNRIQAPEFNGDGYSDLTFSQDRVPDNLNRYVALINNKSGKFEQISTYKDGALYADLSGDGRTDLIGKVGSTVYNVYVSTGSGLSAIGTLDGDAQYSSADFNGDGCADVLRLQTDPKVYLGEGGCEPHNGTIALPTDWSNLLVLFGDWNGDGIADVLTLPINTSNDGTLYLSTGTSFVASGAGTGGTIAGSSDWWKYQIITGDWNGDGRTDLALIAAGFDGGYGAPQGHRVYLSTGTGFTLVDTIANPISDGNTKITAVVGDWNNDGANDFWLKQPGGDKIYSYGYAPDLVSKVDNGLGVATNPTYQRLNQPGVYSKGATASYPNRTLTGPMSVVARLDSGNGLGPCIAGGGPNCYSSTYAYEGGQTDLNGRGFLGFAKVTVTDVRTSIVQVTKYHQDFPLIGLLDEQTKTHGSVTVSDVTTTYQTVTFPNTTRQIVEVQKTITDSNDLDGTAMPRVTITYDSYDDYANPTHISQTTTLGGGTKVSENEYSNDLTHWYLGRLTSAKVTSTIAGQDPQTRSTAYGYDPATGILTSTKLEPDTPAFRLITTFTIDDFGNRLSKTETGHDITSRTTSNGYTPNGQFVNSITNALNQTEQWVRNAKFGLPTKRTDLNGLDTQWDYDNFGRMTKETRPDGTFVSYQHLLCSGVTGAFACPSSAVFVVIRSVVAVDGTTKIEPTLASYFDGLSRPVGTKQEGFDGRIIRADLAYEVSGRIKRTNLPYFESGGDATRWTVFNYDDLGRVIVATSPDGGVTTTTYQGLTITTKNPKNQTTVTVKNARNLPASVTDNLGNTTTFLYDPFDNLRQTKDPAGNKIQNTFDIRGNKTDSTDPDLGAWHYQYDALNELIVQTDAKGQETDLTYDVLGRLKKRVEPGLVSTWTYDTATDGVGRLAEVTTNHGYTRTHTYDALSRPKKTALVIGGTTYNYLTSYNSNTGNVSQLDYPSGLSLSQSYNNWGFLSQIIDVATGNPVWRPTERDAALNLLTSTSGANLVTTRTYDPFTNLVATIKAGAGGGASVASFTFDFDTVGNLTDRADLKTGLSETFTYDGLNRLKKATLGSGASKSVTYDDAGLGNIATKTGVGTYTYGQFGAGPHAVTSIVGTVNGVLNPTFSYDANGNLVSGAGRTITWTSFNMASLIVQGGQSVSLTYGADHQRITQTTSDGETRYLKDPTSGAMSERFIPSGGGASKWQDYIMADGKLIAVRSMPDGGSGAFRYFVTDHLGSIAVIANGAGTVLERLSYDAWGLRRNPDGTDPVTPITSAYTTRGFTGQEMLDAVGLINLNARVYDPLLGRFMSADPSIEEISIPQAFNRYSYVLNNPLSFTDPSGLCFLGCFWKQSWFRPVLAITAVVTLQYWILPEILPEAGFLAIAGVQIPNAVIAAGISGGVGGLINSGTLKGTLLGVVQAVAFFEVGDWAQQFTGVERTAATFISHGLVGGLTSELGGGSFGSGFIAAGFSSLASPITGNMDIVSGTVTSAVLGGVGAELGGGKFQNGAITGAYGYLFNQLMHDQKLKVEEAHRQQNAVAWRYRLDQPSANGGWVVQHVQITFENIDNSGVSTAVIGPEYWEAFHVSVGQTVTDAVMNNEGYGGVTFDDVFVGIPGTSPHGNVYYYGVSRFYEGLQDISAYGFQYGVVPQALQLPATTIAPNLPTNGTNEVVKQWKFTW